MTMCIEKKKSFILIMFFFFFLNCHSAAKMGKKVTFFLNNTPPSCHEFGSQSNDYLKSNAANLENKMQPQH